MSTSLSVVLKRLGIFLLVVLALLGVSMIFSYDIIKLQWVPFMGIQPSFSVMENPLPVPARSIPIDGPAYIPGAGAPENPVPADAASVERGAKLYAINCQMCHGDAGTGTGTISAFLVNRKPADLTSELTQSKDDGTLFLIISYGVANQNASLFPDIQFSSPMPPLSENLSIADRWDLVNYIRTLTAPGQ
ncbi:MAG: cytochrome c [Chloroflexota bacterium]